MFKRKKKKTGCETPTYSRFSMAPEPARPSKPNLNYVPPASVKPPKPPTSGSNAVKPSELLNMLKTSPVTILPNDISMVTIMCQYETPCGWCCKWDKKCDKKIGCGHNDPVGKRGYIGICPNCGRSGHTSWNPATDVSSCDCGWNNSEPQRGLRANAGLYDECMDPVLKDIISGKGLKHLDANLDPNKPLPSGLRWEVKG